MRLARAFARSLRSSPWGISDLTGANLPGVRLVRADLTGADLTRANLGGAHLAGVVWSERTRWPTAAWEERMPTASELLPDGRLRSARGAPRAAP
ncbi:pentapeptide repeat-containing protein [Nonomuraea sp. NPDC050153]|uniref:pentapeptide repeat-containing protein n=1 Tax=Nonomuraea sp. NPDC050153 TaxID=3364359 RepID=UPI0037B4A541